MRRSTVVCGVRGGPGPGPVPNHRDNLAPLLGVPAEGFDTVPPCAHFDDNDAIPPSVNAKLGVPSEGPGFETSDEVRLSFRPPISGELGPRGDDGVGMLPESGPDGHLSGPSNTSDCWLPPCRCAETRALSSANASQNALCVMKLSLLENKFPQSQRYSRVPHVFWCAFQSDCTAYRFEHLSHFHFFSPCLRQKCFLIPVRSPRAREGS